MQRAVCRFRHSFVNRTVQYIRHRDNHTPSAMSATVAHFELRPFAREIPYNLPIIPSNKIYGETEVPPQISDSSLNGTAFSTLR